MNWKKWYRECALCPRECGVDRLSGRRGFCGQTASLKVARAALHMWEEPCISGTRGSGTVFFTGCHLGCVFCQNGQISRGGGGKEISILRLAEIFMELQQKGAHNINLVTPTHFVPQIVEALRISRKMGLCIPRDPDGGNDVFRKAVLRQIDGRGLIGKGILEIGLSLFVNPIVILHQLLPKQVHFGQGWFCGLGCLGICGSLLGLLHHPHLLKPGNGLTALPGGVQLGELGIGENADAD